MRGVRHDRCSVAAEDRKSGRGDAGDFGLGELTWKSRRSVGTLERTEAEKLDDGLRGLETPVCANHTQTDFLGDALAYDSGTLRFAAYRYYKAFCELNHLKPPAAS
ncbi:MAG TPA: hypothetical protein VMJ10_18830 [Kofleriaceae bacterium]|nr:hypothetical protein [Kofleriaceae bacterium]